MKIGQHIIYFDKSGKKHDATVKDLVISGPTGKTLDLTYDGGDSKPVEVKNVAHGPDHAPGEGFWLLEGEAPPPAKKKAGKQ